MPDLITTTATISRDLMSLDPLELTPEGGYFIQRDGFGPGEISWRRNRAQSPFVMGQVLVHAVKDLQISTLKVRVEADTESELYFRMSRMCQAFDQFRYELVVQISSGIYTYQCEAADYSIGDNGNIQDLNLRSLTQTVTFSIPHAPKPTNFW